LASAAAAPGSKGRGEDYRSVAPNGTVSALTSEGYAFYTTDIPRQ
jgi:hypothetical protein